MEYKKPQIKAERFTLQDALLAEELSATEDTLPGFHDDDNTPGGPGQEIVSHIFETVFDII